MASSLEKRVLGGVGLASVIVAGVTVIYHVKSARLVESTDRVTQTHAMLSAIGEFSRSLLLARMCTRGYVLTGDEDLLRTSEAARARS